MNKHQCLVFIGLLITPMSRGYNIGYEGLDANVSYETSWGKERFVKEDYLKYYQYYEPYVENINFADVSNWQQLPAPYCELQNVFAFNKFGMYFNSKFIKKLFEHNNIVNAIEIGSYFGRSTRHIASLLPDDGKLYAVDSWAYDENMYDQFLSNVVHAGLTHKIVPIKKMSNQAVPDVLSYHSSYDFVYVDGDHATEPVLQDLELYFPLLSQHGVICGDDWLIRTVRTAVLAFAQEHQLTVYGSCNFWFLKNEGQFAYHDFMDENISDDVWVF